MTLRPTDMLQIQSAIDAYERKFPRRPTPTAEVALEWRLGKKAWAKRQATERTVQVAAEETAAAGQEDQRGRLRKRSRVSYSRHERSGILWLLGQLHMRWLRLRAAFESSDVFEDSAPLVQSMMRVGLWGVAAVVIVSVFLLGAVVGGFK